MLQRNFFRVVGFATIALPMIAFSQGATQTSSEPVDVFTPVVARLLGSSPSAMAGTDGLYHGVYELELSSTKPAPATLQRIDVLDADAPSHVVASYSGNALLGSLRTLQPTPAADAIIPAIQSRLFYIELAFSNAAAVPHALAHHLVLLGGANLMDGPSALGSQGVPYMIGDFALAGQVDIKAMAAAPTLVGDWGKHRLATPIVQNDRFPLDLNIVNFVGQWPRIAVSGAPCSLFRARGNVLRVTADGRQLA